MAFRIGLFPIEARTSHHERFTSFALNAESHTALSILPHPQANGQVERANRTIIPLLSLSISDQRHEGQGHRANDEHHREQNDAIQSVFFDFIFVQYFF